MIDKLKTIADKYLEMYKDNSQELKKYKLIRKILDKKDCFLNMDIEYAYSILRDLKVSEDKLKDVYLQLISY